MVTETPGNAAPVSSLIDPPISPRRAPCANAVALITSNNPTAYATRRPHVLVIIGPPVDLPRLAGALCLTNPNGHKRVFCQFKKRKRHGGSNRSAGGPSDRWAFFVSD